MKKKRVWAASPVFYILSVLLFVMAGISWFQGNTALFAVELVAAALAVAAVLLLVLLVFAVIGAFDGTSFVQGFEDALNGSFLGRLYESNPVKFS